MVNDIHDQSRMCALQFGQWLTVQFAHIMVMTRPVEYVGSWSTAQSGHNYGQGYST